MLISELAQAVHENAVQHGWWDEKQEAPEIVALIHSEWSEALEEARAGRPLLWYECADKEEAHVENCDYISPNICKENGPCAYKERKPEGVAVELIDGCIRILDYFGKTGIVEITGTGEYDPSIENLFSDEHVSEVPDKIPNLIAHLHSFTTFSFFDRKYRDECVLETYSLLSAMEYAMSWVKKQGYDPLAILLEKHEYNKTRPYKHGKKF